MSEQPVISVKNVSVRFNLAKERTDTIKEFSIKLLKRQLMFQEFYALRDISFTVKKGESIALIGRNGSGKSTLLKCIAGVLYPTRGQIIVRGSIAPMIELGAGFDMDLTARENIYLNGAVLGYSRHFMNEYFNDIINFAELWDFVDVPIKNYSSGMIARLGFAIATEINADILVVDEVLSVGDYRFQEKCKERMNKMIQNGATMFFVSHDKNQVTELCKKCIYLKDGGIFYIGPTDEAFRQYEGEIKE